MKFLSCFLTSLQEENFSGTDDEDNEDGDDDEVAKLSSMILEQISTSLRHLYKRRVCVIVFRTLGWGGQRETNNK